MAGEPVPICVYDKMPEIGYWCTTRSSGNGVAVTFLKSEQLLAILTRLGHGEREGRVIRPPPLLCLLHLHSCVLPQE